MDITTLCRPGVKDLSDEMKSRGFFSAPCSGGNHLCQNGGLAEHSSNVTETALQLRESLLKVSEIGDADAEFSALVETTKRNGIFTLLQKLKADDFFTAQCRGKRHSGKLVEHSLKTAYAGIRIAKALGYNNTASVVLCTALHDVGDIELAALKEKAANIPNAIRSLLYAETVIDLTEEEEWAMLTHDALYGDMRAEFMGHETPLALIVHWAELWALQADAQNMPSDESVALCAAIHDLGKTGDYGKELYVPNILKSGKPSAAKPYKRNENLSNVPHAIRSVKIASRFVDLTEEERWAILAHDGLYDFMRSAIIGHETPLSLIIHMADMWSSRVLERCDEDGDEPVPLPAL